MKKKDLKNWCLLFKIVVQDRWYTDKEYTFLNDQIFYKKRKTFWKIFLKTCNFAMKIHKGKLIQRGFKYCLITHFFKIPKNMFQVTIKSTCLHSVWAETKFIVLCQRPTWRESLSLAEDTFLSFSYILYNYLSQCI